MSRSKTATPAPAPVDHPAHALTFVDEEIKANLLKTPVALLLEQDTYKIQLNELRNHWHYAWVIQWLYYFRGAIKLTQEPFTVDLVEEELVGLTEPNLINRIPTGLAAALLGTKVTIDDFSFRARFLLGDSTSVLGTEEQPVEYQALSLVDKFEVLYCLIQQIQYSDIFRAQIEKYENPSELRFEPIFEDSTVSFYLLSDSRIYKRTITSIPEMNIPRKYKYAKLLNPEEHFANVEPEVEWELVAIGIYQIHDFLVSLKGNKKMKSLFDNIKDHINELAQEDLNTRKKILKRKREQKLNDLLSNRKRSSRLVQKEEEQKAELEKQKEQEELYKKQQEKAKMQRKYKQKVNMLKREMEERIKRQTQSRRSAGMDDIQPSSLEGIELGEGEWMFECYCGIKEKNYDDGVKMVVCERCQRWQHLKCQDRAVRQDLATKADEVLICRWCMQDLEKEVEEKVEQQRLAEEEAEKERERQRELQRELHRKKMEEDRRRLDEEERKLEEAEKMRREEMEKERQRRFLERQNAVAVSVSSDSGSDLGNNEHTPQPHMSHPPHPQSHVPQPQGAPLMGTFQAAPPMMNPNGHMMPMPMPTPMQMPMQMQMQQGGPPPGWTPPPGFHQGPPPSGWAPPLPPQQFPNQFPPQFQQGPPQAQFQNQHMISPQMQQVCPQMQQVQPMQNHSSQPPQPQQPPQAPHTNGGFSVQSLMQ